MFLFILVLLCLVHTFVCVAACREGGLVANIEALTSTAAAAAADIQRLQV